MVAWRSVLPRKLCWLINRLGARSSGHARDIYSTVVAVRRSYGVALVIIAGPPARGAGPIGPGQVSGVAGSGHHGRGHGAAGSP